MKKRSRWINNLIYFRHNLFVDLMLEVGAYILGFVIFFMLSKNEADATSYFPAGSGFFLFGFAMSAFFGGMAYFIQQYNMAISMGDTRKHFMMGFVESSVVYYALEAVLFFILTKFELFFYTIAFPGIENGLDMTEVFRLRWLVLVLVIYIVIRLMVGMIVLKFGKAGFVVLWGIYMVICLGVPRILENIEKSPNGKMAAFAQNIQNFFADMSVKGRFVTAYVVLAIAGIISIVLLSKQEVKQS